MVYLCSVPIIYILYHSHFFAQERESASHGRMQTRRVVCLIDLLCKYFKLMCYCILMLHIMHILSFIHPSIH